MFFLKLLRSSPGTAIVLAVQLVVFIAIQFAPPGTEPLFLLRGLDVLQGRYLGAIMSMMAHVWVFHWLSNAYGTLVLGVICERFLGTGPFLLVFFGAGLMGNVASLLFMDATTPSLGSSGAVFGLIGALLADEINRGRRVRDLWHFPFGRQLLVVTALNLAIGLSLHQFINNYAHVGGLVSGFAISLLFVSTNRRPDDATDPWLRAGVVLLFALLTIWACVPAFRPDASNALAYMLALKGRQADRATRLAEEARRLDPEDVMIEGTLAVCYIRQGRAPEAVPLLEDTVRRHQKEYLRAIDLLWLALAKEKSGDLVGARRTYGEAVKSGNSLEPAERGEFEIVRRAVKAEMQRSK